MTWCLFAVFLVAGCGTAEMPAGTEEVATPTDSVKQGECDPYAQYCAYCGDGWCDPGEDEYNCPNDCGSCGDGTCLSPQEDPSNCAADCSCGNGVCEAERGERCDSCPGDCGFCDTYCARPVITSAAIWDIREADVGWPFNGRNGYPYFTVASGKKVGNVARRLDNQFFDTDVYASNFQGPNRVVDGGRPQWEWDAGGSTQTSNRVYPAEWAKRCYTHLDRHYFNLFPAWTNILEDDEGAGDDKLGEIELSLAGCNSEVFDLGLTSGWATTRQARLVNNYSISYVQFKTWCYKCPNTNSDCMKGVYYGQCNGTSGQWNGCRGDGCSVCDEKVAGYTRYFQNHPLCQRNTICGGQYFQCNANCPAPTAADL